MTLSLDILDRLIGFNTVSARSNLDLIGYVTDFLITRGFRVTPLPDPDMEKAGIYAEIGPPGAGILLSAHSDVVPTEGQVWTKPAFRMSTEGDRIYGRGTTDMKGFLAEMLAAADRASRMDLKEPLKLVLSYDEEVGCTGIARMQDRLAPLLGTPRLAIIGEPTEMQIALGHKGKRAYHARITGEAGHSALAPRFVNALHAATDFIQALRQMQERLHQNGAHDAGFDIPCSTIHIGRMTGGTALNIVPDLAELWFEFRHLAADDPDTLEAEIRALAQVVTTSYGPPCRIELTEQANYPGLDNAMDGPALRAMRPIWKAPTCKVAFGTEAGFFAGLDIPSLVCGPGSMKGQGHKADEYITRDQLNACRDMLDKALHSLT